MADPRPMVHFRHDRQQFLYRVAGVFVRDGQVLLLQFESKDWYCLPGGRVELGETAAEAVCRELREELGVDCAIGRPLWLVENFFEEAGADIHEIGLFYEASLPDGCAQAGGDPWSGVEVDGKTVIHFRWHPIDRLADVTLYPHFLTTALADPPPHLTHVLNRHLPAAP